MSSLDEEIVVLAIADRALRSMWSARLGLAGEILVIVDRCDEPALDAAMRNAATLITDLGVPCTGPSERIAAVRRQGWCNGVILLVSNPQTDCGDPLAVMVARNAETRVVVALLRAWRRERTLGAAF